MVQVTNVDGNSSVQDKKVVKPATTTTTPVKVPVGEKAEKEPTPAELKTHYLDDEIENLKAEYHIEKDPKKQEAVREKIVALQDKQLVQRQTASLGVDETGKKVVMTLKQDITAKELKERFALKEGALRPYVSRKMKFNEAEAREIPVYDESTVLKKGSILKLAPEAVNAPPKTWYQKLFE